MKIVYEVPLSEFNFRGGAKYTREWLTDEELDIIEEILDEEDFRMTDGELNDLFWFDRDWIAECLDYEDWDAFEESHPERAQ